MTSAPARTTSAEVSDAELAKQARSGDRESLDQLVRRHAADVYKLCHHVAGRDDGRDAAQQALEKIVMRIHQYDPSKGAFRTWALTVARNTCRDRLRRRGLERATFARDGEERTATAPGRAPGPVAGRGGRGVGERSRRPRRRRDPRCAAPTRGVEGAGRRGARPGDRRRPGPARRRGTAARSRRDGERGHRASTDRAVAAKPVDRVWPGPERHDRTGDRGVCRRAHPDTERRAQGGGARGDLLRRGGRHGASAAWWLGHAGARVGGAAGDARRPGAGVGARRHARRGGGAAR